MKVEVKEKEVGKVKDFPKMMISEKGSIVLFSEWRVGVMLFDPMVQDLEAKVGIPWTGWVMEYFSDFEGSITLSND